MNHLQRQWIDDKTIPDTEGLWRHINTTIKGLIVKDPKTGQYRPSSAVFRDKSGEPSVDLASLTTVGKSLALKPDFIITEIQAKIPREMGYAIVRDPQPDNPAHALICGRITKAHAREMAESAKLPNHISYESQ
ncbi:hypothetical protein HYR99_17330 [Candidatus Poribacteria bacterium]|nr:hypothetical protein [Candidatus Poribacteria bacterium]